MSDEKLSAFCLDDYRALIGELLKLGYRPTRLADLLPDRPDLYLRHDVDLSLARALSMAEAEADLGVFSTYFVLVSTTLYNPASADSRRLLARIIKCGHEVGLHFDVTQAGAAEDLHEAAAYECDILSQLTGRAVETISFHRPAPELLNRAGRFAGRRHTYEPAFFSEIAYLSDSNGGWHHGHPLAHPAVAARTAIQLLTHPIWWVGNGPRAPIPLLQDFVSQEAAQLDASVSATVTAYARWRAQDAVALDG